MTTTTTTTTAIAAAAIAISDKRAASKPASKPTGKAVAPTSGPKPKAALIAVPAPFKRSVLTEYLKRENGNAEWLKTAALAAAETGFVLSMEDWGSAAKHGGVPMGKTCLNVTRFLEGVATLATLPKGRAASAIEACKQVGDFRENVAAVVKAAKEYAAGKRLPPPKKLESIATATGEAFKAARAAKRKATIAGNGAATPGASPAPDVDKDVASIKRVKALAASVRAIGEKEISATAAAYAKTNGPASAELHACMADAERLAKRLDKVLTLLG